MKKGYITIKEKENNQFYVDIKIIDGTLWMTKHEIAYLFNVVIGSVDKTIKAIFKSGILRKENVTKKHNFRLNGKVNEIVQYNLDAIIHIGFSVASFEGKAFREYIIRRFCGYVKMVENNSSEEMFLIDRNAKIPFNTSLN